MRELNDILNEQKENLPSECFSWIAELTEKQKALDEAAVKFKEHMVDLCNQNPVVEENQPLQKRIKDAANYFSAEIMKWKEKFFNHPLSTDTKKTARKIDTSLNEINFIVHEILHKINHCKNGFLLNDYLKNGKKVVPIYRDEKIQSSYAQNQIRNISSKELEHSGLYDSIAEMRRRIGSATNLPLYTIFSNNAIKNVCMSLPGSKDALLKVKGFGKAKVKKYGDEVLGLVREYCLENNLEPQQIFKEPNLAREKKSTTVEETLKHFKQGKSIEEIARERNLVVSTIEGHFAQAIKYGLVHIEELMPMEEVNKIAGYFPKCRFYSTVGIKSRLLGTEIVSYGKLKMVLAWLQKDK